MITYEKPKRIEIKNVCYWFEKSGELLGGMKNKARKFLEHNCIEYKGNKQYICKPIQGYNSTTHQIDMIQEKCTCQASKRNGIECSHIKAVKLYKFMRCWNEENN